MKYSADFFCFFTLKASSSVFTLFIFTERAEIEEEKNPKREKRICERFKLLHFTDSNHGSVTCKIWKFTNIFFSIIPMFNGWRKMEK